LVTIHGTFSKTDHILGHKENLNKYRKTEVISHILIDNNKIKLEINGKENHKNHSNSQRLNNILRNVQRVIEEIRKEINS
jgi:hypothetical protein